MMNSISNFVVAGGFSFGLVTEKLRPDERKKFLVMTVEEVKGVGGGGVGFRGDMVEPSTWYEEEPLPPPRWRQQEDWPDRETPPPSRHWERDHAVITINQSNRDRYGSGDGKDRAAIGGEVETSV